MISHVCRVLRALARPHRVSIRQARTRVAGGDDRPRAAAITEPDAEGPVKVACDAACRASSTGGPVLVALASVSDLTYILSCVSRISYPRSVFSLSYDPEALGSCASTARKLTIRHCLHPVRDRPLVCRVPPMNDGYEEVVQMQMQSKSVVVDTTCGWADVRLRIRI